MHLTQRTSLVDSSDNRHNMTAWFRSMFLSFAWMLPAWVMLLAVPAPAQAAEPGLTASTVRIGVLMPLSTDFASVGISYVKGAKAAAAEINRRGGVAGRKISLLPVDTPSIAPLSVAQAKETLKESDPEAQVFALMGVLGHSASVDVGKYLETAGVPLIGVASGQASSVKEAGHWVFPVRASDGKVLSGLAKQLETMLITRLAVVRPRGADANWQMQVLQDALKASKVQLVFQVEVGDTNIDLVSEVKAVLQSKPDAVLSFGSYQMTAALVNQVRAAGYRGMILTHSDVGTRTLGELLGEHVAGIGIASGLPSPQLNTLQVIRDFRVAMEKSGQMERSDLDEAALEGYLAIRVFAEGMALSGRDPTRQSLRKALDSEVLEIGGLSFDYTNSENRGLVSTGSLYVMSGPGRIRQ